MATPTAAPADALPAAGFDAPFLLEMIVCDAHWCAMDIATLAQLLAAQMRPGATGNLRSCRHLLHDDSKAMKLALRYGAEVGLGADEVTRLGELYDAVAAAQAALAPLTKFPSLTETQRLSLRNQAGVWRRLAAEASSAITQLDGAARASLNRNYIEDAETLRQYLKRAADGDARDVDPSGVIHLPELKQRFRGEGRARGA